MCLFKLREIRLGNGGAFCVEYTARNTILVTDRLD